MPLLYFRQSGGQTVSAENLFSLPICFIFKVVSSERGPYTDTYSVGKRNGVFRKSIKKGGESLPIVLFLYFRINDIYGLTDLGGLDGRTADGDGICTLDGAYEDVLTVDE